LRRFGADYDKAKLRAKLSTVISQIRNRIGKNQGDYQVRWGSATFPSDAPFGRWTFYSGRQVEKDNYATLSRTSKDALKKPSKELCSFVEDLVEDFEKTGDAPIMPVNMKTLLKTSGYTCSLPKKRPQYVSKADVQASKAAAAEEDEEEEAEEEAEQEAAAGGEQAEDEEQASDEVCLLAPLRRY
jgi:hypothetical protein